MGLLQLLCRVGTRGVSKLFALGLFPRVFWLAKGKLTYEAFQCSSGRTPSNGCDTVPLYSALSQTPENILDINSVSLSWPEVIVVDGVFDCSLASSHERHLGRAAACRKKLARRFPPTPPTLARAAHRCPSHVVENGFLIEERTEAAQQTNKKDNNKNVEPFSH